ncbi:hypothetical protein H1R20_g4993, partial [Candolleomyces eurysporus]
MPPRSSGQPPSSTAQPSEPVPPESRNLTAAEIEEAQAQMDDISGALHSSDLAVTRGALKKSHILIASLLRKLKATTAELALAEAKLVNIAAEQRKTRRGKGTTGTEGATVIPSQIVQQGNRVADTARIFGKLFTIFFNPYMSEELFGVVASSIGWSRNDTSVRYDPAFPDNIRIGRALDLLFCLPAEARKMAEDNFDPFIKQMLKVAESERTQIAHRARDAALDIYEPIKNLIDDGFAELDDQDIRLTFKRPGQKSSETEVTGFGTDFFLPDCNIVRKDLPGLGELIGIVEYAPGKFSSSPLCPLLYKTHHVVAGEEFLSPVLFRLARAVLYGPKSAMKTEGLVLNANNALKKLTLKVTPGLIAGFSNAARIIASPDPSFSKDGKGSFTGIDYAQDLETYTQFLMAIWNEPGGQKIAKAWTENLFPTAARASSAPAQSSDSAAVPRPPPSESLADLIARNRRANQAVQSEAELDESGCYQLPTTEDWGASLYGNQDSDSEKEGEDSEDDDGNREILFDEENGIVVERTTATNISNDREPTYSLVIEEDSPHLQAHLQFAQASSTPPFTSGRIFNTPPPAIFSTRDQAVEAQTRSQPVAPPTLMTASQTHRGPPPIPPRSTRPSPVPALAASVQNLTFPNPPPVNPPPDLPSSSTYKDTVVLPNDHTQKSTADSQQRQRPRPRPLNHHLTAATTPHPVPTTNTSGGSSDSINHVAAAVESLNITADSQDSSDARIQSEQHGIDKNQSSTSRRTTRSTAGASTITAPLVSTPVPPGEVNPTIQLSVIAEVNEEIAPTDDAVNGTSRSKGKAKGAAVGKRGKRKKT